MVIRGIWKGLVPISALALGLALFMLRRTPEIAAPQLKPMPRVALASPPSAPQVYPPATPPAPESTTSAREFGKAYEETYFRECFVNFRNAVAQENLTFQDMYRPILLKDREFALRLARDHVEKSVSISEFDRQVAQKVLDELRR